MSTLSLVDAVLTGAWVGSAVLAWLHPGRRALLPLAAGIAVLSGVAVLGHWLERATGGRLWHHPAAAATGLALVLGGALLHARARAAMGAAWGPTPAPGDRLVTAGPYATMRHPAYAGLAAMAVGTVLAHPSLAVAVASAGLVLGLVAKSRVEDRRLGERFGTGWREWADRVSGFWPAWITRRGKPR